MRHADSLNSLVQRERRGVKAVDVPWSRRLRLWRRGFLGESDLIYDLSSPAGHLYLTDVERFVKTFTINVNPILVDKVIFYFAMRTLGAPVPRVFGLVERGITWVDPPASFRASDGVLGLLQSGWELVLKPLGGQGGRGVSIVSLEGDVLRVDGAPRQAASLDTLLTPGTLIQERVRQGQYAARIFPAASNTVRVLTMWDYDQDEPFVARAVHRFGTSRSAPVDNWSRGGLSAAVDLSSGELGRAAPLPYAAPTAWHSHHPETGEPIAGTVIPGWDAVLEELLRVVRRLPRIVYVGWDVAVDDGGFHILEGNSAPDVNLLQVHGPLLVDPRVRTFYRHHGVISR